MRPIGHLVRGNIVLHPALYAIGAAVLFGASTPFAKLLLADMAPLPLAASLYLGSGLGILPFLVRRRRLGEEAALRRADLPWLLGAIVAGGILAPVALLYGLAQTPAETASLLLNLEVVATALFALLLFREGITLRVWTAILVLVFASLLLSWNGGMLGVSPGALGIIAATTLWGLDNNLTCVISGKDPLAIATLKGFLAGGVLAIAALVFTGPYPIPGSFLLAMLLGFFAYGLSTILFVLSLRHLGSTRTSSYFSIAPFAGALLSLIIFLQTPGILFLAALVLMLAGVFLLVGETHTHPHRHYRMVHEHRHRHDDLHHPHHAGTQSEHTHPHQHEEAEHTHSHTADLHHRHKEKEKGN
ncbi:MAG: DMT family transporter [Methanomicrobiales archaeon]|nr:DMT family transporter [Methanomicrobiales archaeon]